MSAAAWTIEDARAYGAAYGLDADVEEGDTDTCPSALYDAMVDGLAKAGAFDAYVEARRAGGEEECDEYEARRDLEWMLNRHDEPRDDVERHALALLNAACEGLYETWSDLVLIAGCHDELVRVEAVDAAARDSLVSDGVCEDRDGVLHLLDCTPGASEALEGDERVASYEVTERDAYDLDALGAASSDVAAAIARVRAAQEWRDAHRPTQTMTEEAP